MLVSFWFIFRVLGILKGSTDISELFTNFKIVYFKHFLFIIDPEREMLLKTNQKQICFNDRVGLLSLFSLIVIVNIKLLDVFKNEPKRLTTLNV